MSEASCMYTFSNDLVVRLTSVGLSLNVVRLFIMRKNNLYVLNIMCSCVLVCSLESSQY